jgi:transcriptional regulator with XRE-family HTH domain
MSNLQAVGAYLRKLREERGLNRAHVAAALNTSESQVYATETGKRNASAAFVFGFAVLVGASGDRLMELFTTEEVAA